MQLSIQASLLNVGNLDRSIKFYQDVLELRRIARSDRVGALSPLSRTLVKAINCAASPSQPPCHPPRRALEVWCFAGRPEAP